MSVDVPVTVTDNAVSVVGDSTVVNAAPAPATATTTTTAPSDGPVTTGEDGILSGNQVLASVTAPITVSGNAVSVIGDSTVIGGSHGTTTGNGGGTWIAPVTSGEEGILSGNQIIPVINAPVNVTGNAVSGHRRQHRHRRQPRHHHRQRRRHLDRTGHLG